MDSGLDKHKARLILDRLNQPFFYAEGFGDLINDINERRRADRAWFAARYLELYPDDEDAEYIRKLCSKNPSQKGLDIQ